MMMIDDAFNGAESNVMVVGTFVQYKSEQKRKMWSLIKTKTTERCVFSVCV